MIPYRVMSSLENHALIIEHVTELLKHENTNEFEVAIEYKTIGTEPMWQITVYFKNFFSVFVEVYMDGVSMLAKHEAEFDRIMRVVDRKMKIENLNNI
jgi:hypothetical protein